MGIVRLIVPKIGQGKVIVTDQKINVLFQKIRGYVSRDLLIINVGVLLHFCIIFKDIIFSKIFKIRQRDHTAGLGIYSGAEQKRCRKDG